VNPGRYPRGSGKTAGLRETELAERFPLKVVTDWLGNSPKVALDHYLSTTEEHFQRAAKCAAPALQNAVQAGVGPNGLESAESPEVLTPADSSLFQPAQAYSDMISP
jgi:hypothetical protein